MNFQTRVLCWVAGLAVFLVGHMPAFAAGPWDGSWVADRALSHRSSTIELKRMPAGSWEFFDGLGVTVYQSNPSTGRGFRRAASLEDPHTLKLVEEVYGRLSTSYLLYLSDDGNTLTLTYASMGWDGKLMKMSRPFVRAVPGDGLVGSWKPAPRPDGIPKTPASGVASSPPQQEDPFWVIWTGPDGTMTWFIPATGETIRGKADSVQRPLTGPMFESTTFTWKLTAPDRLEFTAYEYGKVVEYAVETISADGQTFTDTLWSPGHEDAKMVTVFHRISSDQAHP